MWSVTYSLLYIAETLSFQSLLILYITIYLIFLKTEIISSSAFSKRKLSFAPIFPPTGLHSNFINFCIIKICNVFGKFFSAILAN